MRRLSTILMPVIFLTEPVFAHEVDTCLVRLAQTSTHLQACRVAQTREQECAALEARLSRNVEQCQAEQHASDSIARAIEAGANEVAGEASKSPYQQARREHQWARSRLKPNLDRFEQHFPAYGHFRDALAERFDSRQCPNAYEGARDRWFYTGSFELLRYSMDRSSSAPPQPKKLHLFAPGSAGQCHTVPEDAIPPFIVANIPEQMLLQLDQQGETIRCVSATCDAERQGLEDQFRHYQASYRTYRQLLDCADLVRRNESRGAVKGQPRSALVLPEYCPEKEVHTALLNAKGLVEQLDSRLFPPAGGTVNVTKPE